jgi:hypothetical protein
MPIGNEQIPLLGMKFSLFRDHTYQQVHDGTDSLGKNRCIYPIVQLQLRYFPHGYMSHMLKDQ